MTSMTSDAARYLSEVQRELEEIKTASLTPDAARQSVELLLSNVVDECSADPVAFLCEPEASRAFESILPDVGNDALVSFLKRISEKLGEICSNPFGSHVCDHLLAFVPKIHPKADSEALYEAIQGVCSAVCAAVNEFVSDKFATHVVRRLFCVLSGVDALSCIRTPTARQTGMTNLDLNASLEQLGSSREAPFPDLLFTLVEAFSRALKTDPEMPMQWICSPISGPTLQTLLITLSFLDMSKTTAFIEELLTDRKSKELDRDRVLRCLQGKCSSHFMEVLLRVGPPALFEKLMKECLMEHLVSLSLHPCANFPLQTAMSLATSQSNVSRLVAELGPHFEEIISKNRTGVILALFKKALELNRARQESCDFLVAALERVARNEKQKGICEALVCHGTHAVLGENFQKLSHKGCILLETLFHFPIEHIHAVLKSVKGLNPASLHHLASDSCGGRALEQLFRNSEIPTPIKKRIFTQLKGQWTQLAMSSSGSHLLEACFDFAKPASREEILKSLTPNKDEICKTAWGSAAWKHCQLPTPPKRAASEQIPVQKSKKRKKTKAAQFVAPSYTMS